MSQIVFLYNKSNPFGIAEDVKVFEQVLRDMSKKIGAPYNKPRHSDPLEPPVLCDIAYHFEVPVYSYFPWARKNILLVNPEWFEPSWDSYLHHTDGLIFKCQADADRFVANHYLSERCKVHVLAWTTLLKPEDFSKHPQSESISTGAVWFLGGSRNKREAAEAILPLWQADWIPLKVFTTTPLPSLNLAANVSVEVRDLPESSRRALQAFYPCHLIFSASEALGMAAHEARAAGAYLIGNQLPTYCENFQRSADCDLFSSSLTPLKAGVKDTFENIDTLSLKNSLLHYETKDIGKIRERQKEAAKQRFQDFLNSTATMLKDLHSTKPTYSLKALPPVLTDSECPPITVVTLLHNRRKFVDLALHNLLITDYPKQKIEWIVVEDSDITEEQASDKVMKFARSCLDEGSISVSYIPLPKPVSIGEKRNLACDRAQHDIIVMMDDDDHYPPSSFRRRIAWLTKHPWKPSAVAATTIACYDLLQGTSAVNTPPFTLGLRERVSEATLSFKKSFWQAKPFPLVNMSEGEGFLEGREEEVLELQPQQIIVAMSHGKNASSRRIPPGPSGKPSCFWGFPREFLVFLHGLAGVQIEEEGSASAGAAKR